MPFSAIRNFRAFGFLRRVIGAESQRSHIILLHPFSGCLCGDGAAWGAGGRCDSPLAPLWGTGDWGGRKKNIFTEQKQNLSQKETSCPHPATNHQKKS